MKGGASDTVLDSGVLGLHLGHYGVHSTRSSLFAMFMLSCSLGRNRRALQAIAAHDMDLQTAVTNSSSNLQQRTGTVASSMRREVESTPRRNKKPKHM